MSTSPGNITPIVAPARVGIWILRVTTDIEGRRITVTWRDDVERDDDRRVSGVGDDDAILQLRDFLTRSREAEWTG